ncbi:MAG: hypothetical protein FJ257_00765 [Phycisphaerae bacterium]|nr:hypothetical protein [Phycisphaerae bacterium]
MNRFLRVLVTAVVLSSSLVPLAPVAADGLDALPGAERHRLIQSRMRQIGRGGTVGEVRFAPEQGKVFVRRGDEWLAVGWDGGEPESVDASLVPDPPRDRDRSRTRRGAGRGRQASKEPSPDGRLVAEHRDDDVWITAADGSGSRAITTDGTPEIRYGRASWVYGEELDQDSAMWWSPDSRRLAFYRFDDSRVPRYFLLDGLTALRTEVTSEHYPKPGDPNPSPRLLIHDLEQGTTVAVDSGEDPEAYLYAVQFSPDGRELLFFRLNRRQDHLELVAADIETGASRVVLEERQETWQKHRPTMRFLADGRRFIWESERSGFAHYELWDLSGSRLAELTRGEFPVESIVEVDEDRGVLWFSARCGSMPLDPQLCRVNLDGSDQVRVTPGDRTYGDFRISPDGARVVATGQALADPPVTTLFGADGTPLAVLAEGEEELAETLGLREPELFTVKAADGETDLYGTLHFPSHFDATRRHPLLVEVYGGPGIATVSNRFRPADPGCEFGYVIARIDNRGTPGRGKSFESATYLKLGQVDVDDQAAAVLQLLESRPYLDPARVGITGFSYGGSMAAWALLRHPERFHAGIAGAPVTDWRNYDTIYTERYMRLPAENPEGYDASSAVKQAGTLRGKLLLLHGMVDDNVHPANAWQLAAALQGLDRPFEMMFFPDSAHGIASPSMQRIRWEFLDRALSPEPSSPSEPGEPVRSDRGTEP